jgi:hypothetical protein
VAGSGEFDNDIFKDANLDLQVKPVMINQQNLLPFLLVEIGAGG